MRERPILFNGAMVRAILSGAKTQTRRAAKLPHQNPLGRWEPSTSGGHGARDRKGELVPEHVCIWHTRTGETYLCPFGEPGDRLWVRETWGVGSRPDPWGGFDGIEYRADEDGLDYGDDLPCHKVQTPDDVCLGDYRLGWKPSSHMPRWACRLMLEITAVRVERLQAISEADAISEGASVNVLPDIRLPRSHPRAALPMVYAGSREIFADLWDSTGGDWDSNPWVWVIEFNRSEAD